MGFLDEKTLPISKEINRTLNNFINNQKIPWLRVIKRHIECNNVYLNDWKSIVFKTQTKTVKELAITVN